MIRTGILMLVLIAACGLFSFCQTKDNRVLITVKRNYPIPKEKEQVRIIIPWGDLLRYLPDLKGKYPMVTDRNFGKKVSADLVSIDQDSKPEFLVLSHVFESNEPVFSFLLTPTNERHQVSKMTLEQDQRFQVNILIPFPVFEKKYGKIESVSKALVQSTINLYPDLKNFPVYAPSRWNYEYGFFMLGAYKLGRQISEPAFKFYAQRWLDDFITDDGQFKKGVYLMDEYKLDDILPGRLALELYADTQEKKYKAIADTLISQLVHQPKTSEGGYWHKEIYPNQMWLDGVFMADVFAMQYARIFNSPEWFDEAVHQIELIFSHTFDKETGLMYHGWDESKNPVWAHPQKGTSPEFWGRAIGWYLMALVECLEYIPIHHPDRSKLINILQEVSAGVKRYQDNSSSLWYQVLNKSGEPGNWIETSCSAMFVYAFAKGNRLGILDKTFKESALRAFNSLLDQFVYVDNQGNLHLDQTVKIGTLNPKNSKGDYQYYITTERRINDYKGLAALLFASIELGR